MTSTATSPQEYINELPAERKEVMQQLRDVIVKNLPKGFEETMLAGMISYVVPHSKYPAGYHCNPKHPLMYVSIASQKNYIALHHLGLYGSKSLLEWFTAEYPKYSQTKLDMGKGCVRFKKPEQIPFKLIGELMKKITVDGWIKTYESAFKRPLSS